MIRFFHYAKLNSVAHSKEECIHIDEIMKAAEVFLDFVQNTTKLEASDE